MDFPLAVSGFPLNSESECSQTFPLDLWSYVGFAWTLGFPLAVAGKCPILEESMCSLTFGARVNAVEMKKS